MDPRIKYLYKYKNFLMEIRSIQIEKIEEINAYAGNVYSFLIKVPLSNGPGLESEHMHMEQNNSLFPGSQ